MNNPLTTLLQSLPEKARLWIYALLFIGATVYAVVQATGGDWRQAIGLLLAGVFGGALPASNTPTVKAKAAARKRVRKS